MTRAVFEELERLDGDNAYLRQMEKSYNISSRDSTLEAAKTYTKEPQSGSGLSPSLSILHVLASTAAKPRRANCPAETRQGSTLVSSKKERNARGERHSSA